ncbi:MAG: Zn-ribbon domain-containing OB-fold protein [Syntrophaceae bacterium]|nr:Zn-ribbon domain-containing OB-fold protein [Syntrophaceae bacterium]
MGFEKFGIVSFTSQTKATPFIDHLERGVLAGTKCKGCGTFYFPPRPDCYHCLSSDVEWREITGKGKLISYSTLIYAPTGFEADLPYTIALVEFDNKVKVFGRLSKEVKDEEIKIGMELKYSVVKLPNDRITYEFKKA